MLHTDIEKTETKALVDQQVAAAMADVRPNCAPWIKRELEAEIRGLARLCPPKPINLPARLDGISAVRSAAK